MSYKFDSLMIILNKLDRNETVTVHSLINDLEISERSVHRYLQTLQVAGFPIIYDKKKGTYCFFEGYSLKKPNVSVEESLAFALAKDALKNYGIGMEESMEKLEEKLSIRPTNLPGQVILKPKRLSAAIETYLGQLFKAITNFQRVEIRYKALYSDEESVRKVDPYYIFYPYGFWTLRAYCHLRQGLRTFALDRMHSVKVLDEHFPPRNMSPEEELSTSFGAWIDSKVVDIKLRFDKEITPHVLRRRWHQSQEEKVLKDGRLEMKFKVSGLEDIKYWVYRWLPHVEVVSPKKLKDTIQAELQQAMKKV